MSQKRKSTTTAKESSVSAKKKAPSNRELNLYLKSYKGKSDFHLTIFSEAQKLVKASNVLYPGCHRHITASLVFSDVIYVDCDKKVGSCYTDPNVLEWVKENKEYDGQQKIVFKCENFKRISVDRVAFDLAISAAAGIVTEHCNEYIRVGGFWLVSDSHFDARTLFLNTNFQLKYVWDGESFTEDLSGHFQLTDGTFITKEMVQESIDKPKSKRKFKLQKEDSFSFYLFQKLK